MLAPVAADLIATLLFEAGASAVEVRDGRTASVCLRAHLPGHRTLQATLRRIRRYLGALAHEGLDPGPGRIVVRRRRDRGWAARWRRYFRPLRIGKRLVVTPSWATPTPGQAELTVELDPGMAFGTGLHPTTRMCLELLEEAFDRARPRGVPPSAGRGGRRRHSGGAPSVLDLGTGSGLLAIAAFRYGAGSVLALDTDPVACRVAAENAGRNGAAGGISIRHGSIERAGRRTFDVVLANLTTEALIGLAPRLVRALGSEGRLIASGMLSEQAAQVCAAFGRWGVRLERARRHGGWAAVMLRRAPVRRPVPGR